MSMLPSGFSLATLVAVTSLNCVKLPPTRILPSACATMLNTLSLKPLPVASVKFISIVPLEFRRTILPATRPFQSVNSPPAIIFPSDCIAITWTEAFAPMPVFALNVASILPVASILAILGGEVKSPPTMKTPPSYFFIDLTIPLSEIGVMFTLCGSAIGTALPSVGTVCGGVLVMPCGAGVAGAEVVLVLSLSRRTGAPLGVFCPEQATNICIDKPNDNNIINILNLLTLMLLLCTDVPPLFLIRTINNYVTQAITSWQEVSPSTYVGTDTPLLIRFG